MNAAQRLFAARRRAAEEGTGVRERVGRSVASTARGVKGGGEGSRLRGVGRAWLTVAALTAK